MSPGNAVDNMIFLNGNEYQNKKKKRSIQQKETDYSIFDYPFKDEKKIFNATPGILNGKLVRSIKLFQINFVVNKNSEIVKPGQFKKLIFLNTEHIYSIQT